MQTVKIAPLVGLCILLSACGSSAPPAPPKDGGAVLEAGPRDVAGGPQDAPGEAGGPDATAEPYRAADASLDAARGPDAAAQVDGGAAELPAQVLDAGADQVDVGPLCPAGFYAPGIGPGGSARACDPKAPPGTLPCVNGRDGWCPSWCPALTICGAYGWICCQG